jgi:hypothetical protein
MRSACAWSFKDEQGEQGDLALSLYWYNPGLEKGHLW